MAQTYKVGQYRYTGDASVSDEPCVQLLNTYPENSGEDDSAWLQPIYRDANFLIGGKKCCYQDVLIPLVDSNKETHYLQPGEVCYIELDLAKTSSNTNYVLKLVKKDQSPNFSDYEVLKRFTTPKCENADLKPVRLVLYTESGNIKDRTQFSVAVIDETLRGGVPRLESANVQNLKYKNEVQLIPSWIIDVNEEEKYHYDSFVSTNYYESIFDSLLLEIVRDENDKDLVTTIQEDWEGVVPDSEGEPTLNGYHYILGRWLNVDKPKDETNRLDHLDIKLYKINKILPGQNETIKKIGVWGRPGLVMAINGQRIEIGPSGVFEFEGLDITSFGVFAEGIEDKFVVDYQYTKDITM